MESIIRGVGLERRYKIGKDNFVHALRGADVEVGTGEMAAIMGPSGSGKSTLMHLLGCLDVPDGGEVWLSGRRVDRLSSRELARIRGKEVGFVFQGFNLIPTMTALENVALGAEYAGTSGRQARSRAVELLGSVGLGERTGHMPSELSGGEQQRVAIARSLVNRPAIVLGDEPTGDLDTATSQEVMSSIRDINRETGTTFLLVTHDPEVAEVCERTIHMRDGLVEEDGG